MRFIEIDLLLDLFEFIWIVKILLVNVRGVVILCVVGVFWEYEK